MASSRATDRPAVLVLCLLAQSWLAKTQVTGYQMLGSVYNRQVYGGSVGKKSLIRATTYGLNLNAFYQDYLVRGMPRAYGVEFRLNFACDKSLF